MANKSRNSKIDVLKGIAILLVVLGHTIQYSEANFDDNFLYRIIYSFHMPFFMFISGYLALGKTVSLKKKFAALVIPFILWYLISYLISIFQGNATEFVPYITKLFYSPDYGLWFLWVLFINFCLLKAISIIAPKINDLDMLATAVCVYLLIQTIPLGVLGMGLVKWHFLFFIAGYFFAKYKNKIRFLKLIKILYLVLFPVFVLMWNRIENPLFIDVLSQYFNKDSVYIVSLIQYYRILTPFLGIGFVWSLVPNAGGFIYSQLQRLGTITLDIYVIQQYLIFTSYPTIITFFICLLLSILLPQLIKKVKVLDIALFGGYSKYDIVFVR